MTLEDNLFQQDDFVYFNNGVMEGNGTICGRILNAEKQVAFLVYVLEGPVPSEKYPFKVIVVRAQYLTKQQEKTMLYVVTDEDEGKVIGSFQNEVKANAKSDAHPGKTKVTPTELD